MRDLCAIAGIGATDFSKNSGRSALTLAAQASLAALQDAGIGVADVDGIVRSLDDVVLHNDIAQAIGLRNASWFSHAGVGGTAPSGMVAQAVAAILSGQATTVLAYRSLNGRSGRRSGLRWSGTEGQTVGGEGDGRYDEYFVPYGLTAPGHYYSLLARRHMIQYGTTSNQLGSIALTCRERALANPAAQMFARPLTMDDYLDSRMLADPLRLFDYCLETDGAAAFVITSTDRAQDGPKPPALIRAVAQGIGPDPQGGRMLTALMRKDMTSFPSKVVADTLYRRAGVVPGDIDVAQLYDCFTITLLVQLEDFGFCDAGEGGPFAAEEIGLEGRLPVNTSGGHLSEAYVQGMNHVLEGVRQMRGESTSQVPDAGLCLVTSGAPPATGAFLLARPA